jgi:hypothetical protein
LVEHSIPGFLTGLFDECLHVVVRIGGNQGGFEKVSIDVEVDDAFVVDRGTGVGL